MRRPQLSQIQIGSGNVAFVRESRTPSADGPPLYWRDTADDLVQRAAAWRAVLDASGVTASDRVLLALPASSAVGWDCRSAILELGALSMWSDGIALDDVVRFAPTVLVSTPTDALRLTQAAARQGVDLATGPVQCVLVTGEPGGSVGSTRRRIEEQLGARCFDVYAMTELGVVGWGCAAGGGIHLDEDTFAIESIDPDSERATNDGELG
jgi:phenylacetate-CoA ligase